MEKKFLYVALTLLALVLLAAIVTSFANRPGQDFRGSLIRPPVPAPDFVLTGQAGENVSLGDFRGRYVLIFFGFVNCPDICPATMAMLNQARAALGDQAGQVQVVFVTTDPDRDTPQAIAAYLERFDPSFVGLTGPLPDLQKVWADYGVTVLDGGETHSTYVYLIDPEGNLRLTYTSFSDPAEIAADLRLLFQER